MKKIAFEDLIRISETSEQFLLKVQALFADPSNQPTASAVKALCPTGVENTATLGSYPPGGIFCYQFASSDEKRIVVKYHRADPDAAGGPTCNSAKGCTAQIRIGNRFVFFDHDNQEVKTVRNDQRNWTHLPIQDF